MASLHCGLSAAQDTDDFTYLLFEPVLLEISFNGAETAGEIYQARELTSLPVGDAVDIGALLGKSRAAAPGPETLEIDIARYQQAVAELELAGGPYEPRLSQELLALGTALHQAGDYNAALEVFDRASHVNRVNNGLFNLEQIPIIEKSIENFLAQGDLLAADELQGYLFYLHRKSLGENSVDLLPALTRYAEWNVFAFNVESFPTPQPAAADVETNLSATPAYSSLGMEAFRVRSLITAQNVYQSIIQLVVSNFGRTDPRLPELERKLALTNYYFATTFDTAPELPPSAAMAYSNALLPFEMPSMPNDSLGFREGRDALERRIDYIAATPGHRLEDVATAQLELGDWLMTFRKRGGALDVFDEAWMKMKNGGATAEQLRAVFSPPLPVEIPVFLPHANTRAALGIPDGTPLAYKGFIDVKFTLSRFGQANDIVVLGKSRDTAEYVESRLVRNLRTAQFRPRYGDEGSARDTELIRLRYYYTW